MHLPLYIDIGSLCDSCFSVRDHYHVT